MFLWDNLLLRPWNHGSDEAGWHGATGICLPVPAQGHLTRATVMSGFPKNVLEMKLRSSSLLSQGSPVKLLSRTPNPQSLSSVQCQFSGQEVEAYRLILQIPSARTKFSSNGFSPSPYPPQSAWMTVRKKDGRPSEGGL